jgi:hypothetical protein
MAGNTPWAEVRDGPADEAADEAHLVRLSVDAELILEVDVKTRQVTKVRIVPTGLPEEIGVLGYTDRSEMETAVAVAKETTWEPLRHLPDDVVWEG